MPDQIDSSQLRLRGSRNTPMALAAVVAVVLGWTLAWTSDAHATAPLGYYAGSPTTGAEVNSSNYQLATAGGATWVYMPVYWSSIELSPNVYTWNSPYQALDSTVKEARSAGLKIAFAVQGTPRWDINTDRWPKCEDHYCVPDNLGPYKNFITALQQRYRPDAIQVWNEPNSYAFSHDVTRYENGKAVYEGISPQAFYTQIFNPAYEALNGTHAESGAETKIIAPGTAAVLHTAPERGTEYYAWLHEFIPVTVSHGQTNWGLAQHIYAYKAVSEGACPTWKQSCVEENVMEQLNNIYGIAQAANYPERPPKTIWPTEVGLSNITGGGNPALGQVPGYGPQEQATALLKFYCHTASVYGPTIPMFVFRLVDNLSNPLAQGNIGYGLTQWTSGTYNTNPGPLTVSAYEALNNAAHGLPGSCP